MAAAIASPQQINLYNPALLPAREKFSARQLLTWIVLGLVALGGVAWWATGEMRALRRDMANEVARPARPAQEGPTPQQVAALEQTLRGQAAALEARRAALDAMKRGMAGPDGGPRGVMRRIADTIAPSAWLLDLNVAGSRIDLKAKALDPAAVEAWLERMRSTGLIAEKPAPTVHLDRLEPVAGSAPMPPAFVVQISATLAQPFAVEAGRQ